MAIRDAFETELEILVRTYGEMIRRVIRRVGGDDVAAIREDIEQRVVISLWRQLAREQTINHPSSYIYRAAVRETVRAMREVSVQRARCRDDTEDTIGSSQAADPHRAYASNECLAFIDAALRRLRADRARAVRAHLAGFSVAEIMSLYGWRYQTTRNLIARGLTDLRRLLRQNGINGD